MLNIIDERIKYSDFELVIRREDLIHKHVSGNKYRKLKYNILEAKKLRKGTILTFGGAYSNHIAATAFSGQINGLKTIGMIRGEELDKRIDSNPTLSFAESCGMKLVFIDRATYKNKTNEAFISSLESDFGDFYLIPEGGTNDFAVKGCEEILKPEDSKYDFICVAVGTGGTISGIINASDNHQNILGFPALKGDFLMEDIRKFAKQNNWKLITDYHFGGYAKINTELVTFINQFKRKYSIPLDPIYTGKMLFGIFDLIDKRYFAKDSRILVIHTGGLQGIAGMNQLLSQKNMPQIII
ncbi:1-aminocyclopropane-1-carboxylate deaminase/D-cysteine desulfhydrase [Winogradskyella sp.]|uniref:1-aminocyclopropane-1-carboxylate deaminase/D-cysteine desulfhydrase n=1 Tax=Winogradskyella sp. TaxID=1883156 RepID=UPI003F6CCADB